MLRDAWVKKHTFDLVRPAEGVRRVPQRDGNNESIRASE